MPINHTKESVQRMTKKTAKRRYGRRGGLVAAIHIAADEKGMDRDTYENILMNIAGVKSCSAIKDQRALQAVLHAIKRDRPPAMELHNKIRALWHTLGRARVLRVPSEANLQTWVRRQTGIQSLEWCDTTTSIHLVESLKKWCDRERVQYND